MPSRSKKAAAKLHSERVEVPGVRPASFKMKEWAPDSFHLFRSSRKIGTAAAEERAWSARFRFDGRDWKAEAVSPDGLLRLVGTFILASEARATAAEPVKTPAAKKPRKHTEEEISLRFLKRAQTLRVAEFDSLIEECRKRVKPA